MKFKLIIASVLMPALLSATPREVAAIQFVDGVVRIKPSAEGAVEVIAIPGRVIYENDIIHTGENSAVELVTNDQGLRIKLAGTTEISIEENNILRTIHLDFGSIFTESKAKNSKDSFISTHSSQVKLGNSETWVHSGYAGEDEIYILEGEVIVRNKIHQGQKTVIIGEMVTSDRDALGIKSAITAEMVPQEIFTRLEMNRNAVSEEEPFSELSLFNQDLIPMVGADFEEESPSNFNFTIEIGAAIIEDVQYTKANIIPYYHGEYVEFGYNLENYIQSSDSVRDLNTFTDLYEILDRVMVLRIANSSQNFRLNVGPISNLTYGYGMLLKNYTNSISYPIKRNTGLEFAYQNESKTTTFHFFTSSLREMNASANLWGLYGTMVLSQTFPLRIGLGFIMDMNQFEALFEALPDSLWEEGSDELKRKVSAFQLDLTYSLFSGFRNEVYLFGELAGLVFPETLYYLRAEDIGDDFQEKVISRSGTFSIMGPGIGFKMGHHQELRLALNYTSPLNIAQYFGETYHLERARYVAFDRDSLIAENKLPYDEFSDWNNMMDDYWVSDSSFIFLGKDMHSLLDPTRNVYDKIGISTEYSFNYRNRYSYNIEAAFFKEIGDAVFVETFYTVGLDIMINDGVIKGLSELKLFFKQYYTAHRIDFYAPDENMLMGASVGVKLLKNISLRLHLKDVFYDRDFDGTADLNRTAGFDLVAKF